MVIRLLFLIITKKIVVEPINFSRFRSYHKMSQEDGSLDSFYYVYVFINI
jgi:hypothetical protein